MSQAGIISVSGGGGGGTPIESVTLQTGISPIVPTANNINFNGATVAAGTNPVRTDGTGVSTMALEVQISQAIAASNASNIGLSAFNSAQFSVDANGFVSLLGGTEAIDSIGVDSTSGTGTNPVLPTVAGLVTVNGAVVAAGTNPVRTVSTAPSVYQIQLQKSAAILASNASNVGLSAFNSSQFTVDANGFVSVIGGLPAIETITGDSGGAVGPNGSGNINVNAGNATNVSGSSVSFVGTPGSNLVQLKVTDSSQRTIIGFGAGNLTTTNSGFDTIVGYQAGASLTSGLGGNTLFGWKCGNAITSGDNNEGQGQSALLLLTTGVQNVAHGNNALSSITTGSYNIALGYAAGNVLATSDSSNIVIGNAGTAGDNNKIRIGTQGNGTGQQNVCFIAGIVGVTASNAQYVTINSSTGQLGVATGPVATWTDVTGATQTLAVANGYITDRGGGVTYTLPSTAALGDKIEIVGKAGLATVAQNANQQISIASSSSTVGVGGSIAATNAGDCISLVCITAGASTSWRAQSVVGTWTVT